MGFLSVRADPDRGIELKICNFFDFCDTLFKSVGWHYEAYRSVEVFYGETREGRKIYPLLVRKYTVQKNRGVVRNRYHALFISSDRDRETLRDRWLPATSKVSIQSIRGDLL